MDIRKKEREKGRTEERTKRKKKEGKKGKQDRQIGKKRKEIKKAFILMHQSGALPPKGVRKQSKQL